jgi:hypothetical protein
LVVLGLNCGGSKKVVHVIIEGGGGNRLSNPRHCQEEDQEFPTNREECRQ